MEKNSEIFPQLQQKFLSQIDVGSITIDLDSTVITRYGDQEGASKGYNPKETREEFPSPFNSIYITNKDGG